MIKKIMVYYFYNDREYRIDYSFNLQTVKYVHIYCNKWTHYNHSRPKKRDEIDLSFISKISKIVSLSVCLSVCLTKMNAKLEV